MLKIRPDQLAKVAPFRHRLRKMLCDRFPDARNMTPGELEAGIDQQLKEAQRYKLSTERQLATYVLTAFLLGMDFDTKFEAAARTLLSDWSADEKADWLEEWTITLFKKLEG